MLTLMHVWGVLVTFVVLTFNGRPYTVIYNYTLVLFSFVVYLNMKRMDFSLKEYYTVFNVLLVALVITGLTITIPSYVFGMYGRFSGFYKNPNYAAFAINVSILYLAHQIVRYKFNPFSPRVLLCLVMIAHQFFAILSTGSRSGILLCAGILFFYFGLVSSINTKLKIVAVMIGILFLPLGNPFERLGMDETNNVGLNRITRLQEEGEDEIRLYIWREEIGNGNLFYGRRDRTVQGCVFLGLYETIFRLVEGSG